MVLAVYNYFIRRILGVIVILVYLGAIMILIGYVCAVTPNFIARLNFKGYVYLPIIFSFIPLVYLSTSLFFPQNTFYISFPTIKISLFLFSSFSGLVLLTSFIVLLLLTLVISTYLGVKSRMTGPFRS
jgi:NADH:ubiquinone oxidoreductase subunit 6 (subunit J)